MMPFLFAAILGLLGFVLAGLPVQMRLQGPRLGQPAVVVDGSVEVRLRSSLPCLASPIQIQGPWQEAGRRWDGTTLKLLLKGGSGPIHLNFSGQHEVVPMVQPMNQKRLRLVQTCDLLKPGVPGTEKNMERFLEDMAIVRPDVVLVTGDVSYVGRQDWYDMLKDWFGRLEAMNIRCVAIPGNHERAGWAYWLRNFGPELNHRVDIGPLAILSLDSAHGRDRLTPFQFRWLETQLENLGGRTPLIQIHHPIFPAKLARNEGAEYSSGSGLQGLQKAFVRLCREKQVPMIFSGHWHADAVFDADGKLRDDAVEFAGPKFVTTTTLASEHRRVTRWPGRHWGYRVIEIEDGKVARYTHQNRPIASETLGQAKGGVLP